MGRRLIFLALAVTSCAIGGDPRIGTWKFVSGASLMQESPQWTIRALPNGYDFTPPHGFRFSVDFKGSNATSPGIVGDEVALDRTGTHSLRLFFQRATPSAETYVFSVSEDGGELRTRQHGLTLLWYRSQENTDESDPFPGTWILDVLRSFEVTGQVLSYEPVGENGVRYFEGTGGTFWARYDGKPHKCAGTGFSTVILKALGANTVEEFRSLGTFGSETARFVVSSDHRTMTVIHNGVFDGWNYQIERIWHRY